ncbi:PRAME family member 20-like [Arvicanthis niloticus]|uniref:PRAME family member 20-like n=1 Tax=Arvicanthis niloticus TaxID=61156 RepID=UPI0014869953|nr:PRAME family member 20-like [Arvicanthis niloticus]
MSSKPLLTLQELAGQNLLRNEALAIIALEDLPILFLPQLLKQAYDGNHCKVLRSIVSSWPFPRLPLGVLRKRTPYLETQLQVVLEEIDKLLIQKVRPRKYKLRVLDLRSVGQHYLDVWPGSMDDWLPKTTQADPCCSKTVVTHPLKVAMDLYLKDRGQSRLFSYLVQWSDRRKGLLQLYCNELQIWSPSHQNYRRLSQKVSLEHVETLGLHSSCSPSFLLNLAPYLRQMRNLRKLALSNIREENFVSPEKRRRIITRFTLQLLKLERLQKLHLDAVCFLEGHLDQLLGSVKTSLDDLAVTHCNLSVSEWNHLSEFPCVSQLQHLNLENVRLTGLSPEPLRVLLVKAGPTLVALDLEDCHLEESQLYAILPALSRCSRLTKFSFYGNQISMPAMKDLLHHTARLIHLRLELYPVPQDSYDYSGTPHMQRMQQCCDDLMNLLKTIREPGRVFFGTDRCDQCCNRYIYKKTIMCNCQRSY